MTLHLTSLVRSRSALATALAVACVAPASAQKMTDAAVEAEIEFARGLASDWTFVDLAQGVLDRVSESGPSAEMSEDLALARCELYAVGARRLREPSEINALLEEGINAYQSYIESNQGASNREEAERGLVTLSLVYARSIDNALEEAIGEEADAMKERKVDVLTDAISRTEGLIDAKDTGDLSEAEQVEVWDLKLRKAEMYTEIAKTTGDEYFTAEAIRAYEDLSLDAGSGREIGLRATIGLGDVYLLKGEPLTAYDYYSGTVELVFPSNPQRRAQLGFDDMPRGILELRFTYVELGTQGIQAAAREAGLYEEAIDYAMFMYNLYRRFGFDLSVEGHDALLEVAQTLLDVGGYVGGDAADGEAKWYATEEEMRAEVRGRRNRASAVEFALDLVNQVSETTARPSTKIRAGKLLESINSRPDVEISASALFEAAQAKYVGQEYEAALESYYAVLDRLPSVDPAERIKFAAGAYNGIGNTLRRMDRQMEAALSYRQALEDARDPEYNARNANGYLAAMRSWGRADEAASDENRFKAMMTDAQERALEFSDDSNPDLIRLTQARTLRSDDDFDGAINKYGEIAKDSDYYDVAQMEIGQTMYMAEQFGPAFNHLKGYVDYANDPANAVESRAAQDNRYGALSNATYLLGVLTQARASGAYKRYVAARKEGGDADPSRHEQFYGEVIDVLGEFPTRFGDSNYVLPVQKMLADAHAKLGQGEEAKAIVQKMREVAPDSRETAAAAMDVYFVYRDQRESMDEAGDADPAEVEAVTRNMAEALELANGIVAKPQYAYLDREADLWIELGEYQKAKGKLEAVVAEYADDEKYGENVKKFGIPNLAEVLLMEGDREAAKALLAPLVIGEDALLSTVRPTLLLCRAVFGEVTGSGTRVQIEPGAGGTEEEMQFLVDRLETFASSADSKGEFCTYHARKFDVIFAYYVWQQTSDTKIGSAKRVMDNYVAVKLLGDTQFTIVDEACSNEERTEAEMVEQYGGDVLASRFRWLYTRVK